MAKITRLQELVYEVKVGEVMTRKVIHVTPQTPMSVIRKLLRERRISGVPVVQSGKLEGIISIDHLINALAESAMDTTVGKRMTRNPVTLREDEPVVIAINHFATHGFGRFPVVDEKGQLVGIVTRSDIIHGLLKKMEIEYHEEEIRRDRVSHIFEDIISDRTSIILRYKVLPRDFNRGGEASSNIKLVLTRLGAPPEIVRRAAIAAYETEINLIIHTAGGAKSKRKSSPGGSPSGPWTTAPVFPTSPRPCKPVFLLPLNGSGNWDSERGWACPISSAVPMK